MQSFLSLSPSALVKLIISTTPPWLWFHKLVHGCSSSSVFGKGSISRIAVSSMALLREIPSFNRPFLISGETRYALSLGNTYAFCSSPLAGLPLQNEHCWYVNGSAISDSFSVRTSPGTGNHHLQPHPFFFFWPPEKRNVEEISLDAPSFRVKSELAPESDVLLRCPIAVQSRSQK